jgi:hypothetical protein
MTADLISIGRLRPGWTTYIAIYQRDLLSASSHNELPDLGIRIVQIIVDHNLLMDATVAGKCHLDLSLRKSLLYSFLAVRAPVT